MGYQKTVNFLAGFLLLFSSIQGASSLVPLITAKDTFPKVEAALKNHSSDFFQHTVKRMGNKTIALEAFISFDADWNTLKKITQNIPDYPKWVMPRINERGAGDKFFIRINSIKPDEKKPNQLDIEVALALPGLNIPIQRSFSCQSVPSENPAVITMNVNTLPSKDSQVQDLAGYFHLFKNPKNPNMVWGYFQVSVVLRHWLVYESIPERLLQREAGDRIKIILENYQNFENSK